MKIKVNIIYWAGAIFMSIWFALSGFFEVTKNPLVWNITVKLGFPSHFIYILGIFKLVGVFILLLPNRLLRLKEWVFAGMFFDVIFAFFSKIAVLGLNSTIDAIIAFSVLSLTYYMFRKKYPFLFTYNKDLKKEFIEY